MLRAGIHHRAVGVQRGYYYIKIRIIAIQPAADLLQALVFTQNKAFLSTEFQNSSILQPLIYYLPGVKILSYIYIEKRMSMSRYAQEYLPNAYPFEQEYRNIPRQSFSLPA